MRLLLLFLLLASTAQAQEQRVWLTGDLIGDPSAPPGAVGDFDVFFQWNLSTDIASDFSATCRAFPGPQTESVTVVGNTLQVSGTCGASLFWGGSVVESGPDANNAWIGQVFARVQDQTVSAPEPSVLLLMLTGLGITVGLSRQRLRKAARAFWAMRRCIRQHSQSVAQDAMPWRAL